jgi:hypothetical protein
MDIIFGVIGFILGFGIAKSNSTPAEPSNLEEELREKNNQLVEDISYYKKLCKTISEENAEFRRKQL